MICIYDNPFTERRELYARGQLMNWYSKADCGEGDHGEGITRPVTDRPWSNFSMVGNWRALPASVVAKKYLFNLPILRAMRQARLNA